MSNSTTPTPAPNSPKKPEDQKQPQQMQGVHPKPADQQAQSLPPHQQQGDAITPATPAKPADGKPGDSKPGDGKR